MSLALRHYKMAPNYRISVLTIKNKHSGGKLKIRLHKRLIKQHFRTFMTYITPLN